MKKLTSILVVLSIIFTLAGCNSSVSSSSENSIPNSVASTNGESAGEVDNFEEYAEKIKPVYLSILHEQNWTTPEEIEPDSLCAFYCYVILYLEENPSGWDNTIELTTTEVFEELSKYFSNITETQIKKSSYYDTNKDVFIFSSGFGGAVTPTITDVQYVEGNTVIYYDSMMGNEKNGEGIVTIDESNDSFQFLSNKYTEVIQ